MGHPKAGGRKKGVPNKVTADIKKLAQAYGEDAIEALAQIMNKKDEDPRARTAAAKELLDRGYGKSIVQIGGENGKPIGIEIGIVVKRATAEDADETED